MFISYGSDVITLSNSSANVEDSIITLSEGWTLTNRMTASTYSITGDYKTRILIQLSDI